MARMSDEERKTRDLLVIRLFLAGTPYREIGRHPKINLGHATIGQIVHRELQKGGRSQLYEQASAIYIERLESLLRAVTPRALQGDPKAADLMLRILTHEARYFRIMDNAADWGDEDDLDELEAYRQRRKTKAMKVLDDDSGWNFPEVTPGS
ncbi:hypothetical protein [Mycobacteroides abscessus]|uniref:hypothetical protein n=1 Tax=Mycobacteroides abscessus TaxID=36809 RepID=UPI0019263F5E|nr:hypothetical protein [Mycobacteroides abscessus]MBL3753008.1 hypothetical protein [Mycobacteroides abscessus subsp. massiliense]